MKYTLFCFLTVLNILAFTSETRAQYFSFRETTYPPPKDPFVTLHLLDSDRVLGIDSRFNLWVSDNLGVSWIVKFPNVYGFAIGKKNEIIISNNGILNYSYDNGNTWTPDTILADYFIKQVAVDSQNNRYLWAERKDSNFGQIIIYNDQRELLSMGRAKISKTPYFAPFSISADGLIILQFSSYGDLIEISSDKGSSFRAYVPLGSDPNQTFWTKFTTDAFGKIYTLEWDFGPPVSRFDKYGGLFVSTDSLKTVTPILTKVSLLSLAFYGENYMLVGARNSSFLVIDKNGWHQDSNYHWGVPDIISQPKNGKIVISTDALQFIIGTGQIDNVEKFTPASSTGITINQHNHTIEFQAIEPQSVQLLITNVIGQQVYHANDFTLNSRVQLDISGYPAGMYNCSIITKNGKMYNKKIVVY